MANNDLKLRVMLDFVDKVTKPLQNILQGNKGLAKSLKETRDQLKDLGKTQKDVAQFREMRSGLTTTSTALAAAEAKVKALAGAMHANGPPSKAMARDFEKAKQAASQLKQSQQQQTTQLAELRTRLSGAGIETRNLVRHERELRTSITATTAAMQAQQAKLVEGAARERKMGEARGKMNAMQGTASNMAVGGYAARRAGMAIVGDLKDTVGEGKKFESDSQRINALGLGDHASADAIKFSRAMKVYGTSATDNISIVRDALTVFADEHHAQMVAPTLAKMKFANEAMFGAEDAHANEEKFMNMLKVIELRGGTASEAKFKDEANMVQKVLTATGGRVGADEWRNFIQTGGVAAKQMRKDAFFYQMEPLIQEMGGHSVGTGLMSAYSNVYQGKTTVRAAKQMMALDLLDPKKVEYNKIGMIKQIRPGALAGGDLMKASPLEWLEKVLLPKLAAKGITEPGKVKDMIATIFTNRTASNLFTTMYMQREQIHKNERLNQGAEGIDQLAARGQQMTTGREVAAMAQLRDLKLELGERVMPLYNSALLAGASALNTLLRFMKEHSTTTQIIITTLTVLAGILVVAGSLTIALAGVLGPLAILKFSMTTLGIQGGIMSRVLGIGAGALRLVGQAALFLGRALLMNPIGLAITAIAGGAYLIYTYWTPITAFFSGIWNKVRSVFDGGIGNIAMLLVKMTPMGLIYTYWTPITAFFSGIWNKVRSVFDGGIGNIAMLLVKMTPMGLIYTYWEPITAFFKGMWAKVSTVFEGGLAGITALFWNWSPVGLIYQAVAGALSMFGISLPAQFSTFGANIIAGLINGITNGLGGVKDAIVNVASSTVGWFKDKLGIKSPSRVFGELGGFISEGAAIGIDKEQGKVSKAAAALAAVAAASFAPPAIAHPYMDGRQGTTGGLAQIDARGAVRAPGGAATVPSTPGAGGSNTYTIIINPAPGMEPAAIARAVAAEIDRRERSKQSRVGSRLSD